MTSRGGSTNSHQKPSPWGCRIVSRYGCTIAQITPASAVSGPTADTKRARAVRCRGTSSSETSSAFTATSCVRVQRAEVLRERRRRTYFEREPEQAARCDEVGECRARRRQRGADLRGAPRRLVRERLVLCEPLLDGAVDDRDDDGEDGEHRERGGVQPRCQQRPAPSRD